VRDAAARASVNVVVLQRAQVLTGDAPGVLVVVEIAPEFVVISRAGCVVMAEPRIGDHADVARTVADGVGAATAVLVDAPVGVDGAVELAVAIAECLRTDGVAVTTAAQDGVLTAARHEPTARAREWKPSGRRRPLRMALSAVAASVALLCVGVSVGFDVNDSPAADGPVTLLVEGRVAVKVPALWVVRRITSGPGSARVEVTASDDTTAVLITQSQIRKGEPLAATAAALRRALDDQQAGVFSEFNPDDRRADRPAATYRELRAGRQIDWTVFVDDTVRIAIGCQTSPDSQKAVRDVCEEAIRSAHAVV
jgi:type VII secretion-associated protein (TIGR03931 family)